MPVKAKPTLSAPVNVNHESTQKFAGTVASDFAWAAVVNVSGNRQIVNNIQRVAIFFIVFPFQIL